MKPAGFTQSQVLLTSEHFPHKCFFRKLMLEGTLPTSSLLPWSLSAPSPSRPSSPSPLPVPQSPSPFLLLPPLLSSFFPHFLKDLSLRSGRKITVPLAVALQLSHEAAPGRTFLLHPSEGGAGSEPPESSRGGGLRVLSAGQGSCKGRRLRQSLYSPVGCLLPWRHIHCRQPALHPYTAADTPKSLPWVTRGLGRGC